jgi:cell shape-determining protein MreC
LQSLFPPGVPIGVVSRVDPDEVELYQRVHVRPYADLRRLEFVQILRRNSRGGG